jgi:glyoxylase-like metal-dependent hydrolase (beta-lactamase superfamily II)/rhodanese-related sulfurtransferase
MYIHQIYTQCLSEASYYIDNNQEAIVIDPIREPDQYIELAKERGATIKYIFETHFHADFISGHLDLAKKTGAAIVFGPGASPSFPIHSAADGEYIKIGNIHFVVIHTPGHTPESTSFLLVDEKGKNHAIFTGDTLFIGDVGRPDLAITENITKNDLAGMLFDSIQQKIIPLQDELIVYPGHGPGSACGKNIGKETFSTLGEQKKTNYALQPMKKETFIQLVTEDIVPAPAYFAIAAGINKNGYQNLDAIYSQSNNALELHDFKRNMESGSLILDTRTADEFEKAHIAKSINIGTNGQFAIWAATLLDYHTPLLLIAEPGRENEIITRLARVGLENVQGYLLGGIHTWLQANEPTEQIKSIEPEDLKTYMDKGWKILDVRKPGEFESGHVQGAKTLHLQILEENIPTLSKDTPYLIHCAGGYRSMIAASMLKKHGFTQFVNVRKGWSAIQHLSGLEIETGPCEMEKKQQAVATNK